MTTSVETKPVQWSDIVKRIDPAVLVGVAVFTALVVIDPAQIPGSAAFVIRALVEISPFFFLSIGVAAYAKASGAEHLIARVFEGKLKRMIVAAAIFGALSPFCSCGVIPIVAGLLAAGVPLPPVMAFWLASPLMDPEMFIISWAGLGLHFTTAKTLVAIGVGLLGGFATMFVLQRGFFASPLSSGVQSCCKSSCSSTNATPEVECKIWRAPARRAEFRAASLEAGWFLGKWLTVAFILESIMISYIPPTFVADWLGGGNWWTIPLAVFVGIPAYLNGFAAVPLMASLIDMGMMPGAAMAFMIAGGVTSIPAAIAVFALVRRPVFAWYVALAVTGAMGAGSLYQMTLI